MFISKHIKNNAVLNYCLILLLHIIIVLTKRLTPFRKKPVAGKIVIVVLHRLGDAVFTVPAIKNLVNHHGENLSIICFPETEPIYRIVFNSVTYLNIEHSDFIFSGRIANATSRKILKLLNPELIYDLTGTIASASLLFNQSAKKVIGINEPYYRPIYTHFKRIRNEPHLVDNYLDAISGEIPIAFEAYRYVSKENNGKYVLIHPFTSLVEKEWGLKNYIALAKSINNKYHSFIVSPIEKIPKDVLEDMKRQKINFIETKTISELIEVIKGCSIFIGNDSGPTNIANLLGKPTCTIYGPTNPEFHKPREGLNIYIYKELKCSTKKNEKICALQRITKNCPSYECMKDISLKEVETKVFQFIDRVQAINDSQKFSL